jgi:hypothetical protein
VKVEGVVISHSFAFSASRRLKFILHCTAFPSALVSMLELSPPLPVLLLLRVGGLSHLNTRVVQKSVGCSKKCVHFTLNYPIRNCKVFLQSNVLHVSYFWNPNILHNKVFSKSFTLELLTV